MSEVQEKCRAAISAQMAKQHKEGTLERGVGLLLQQMAAVSDANADVIAVDLANKDMDIAAAAKKLYAYASAHKSNGSFYMGPDVAADVLGKFYALPDKLPGMGALGLAAELGKDAANAAQAEKASAPAPEEARAASARPARIALEDFL